MRNVDLFLGAHIKHEARVRKKEREIIEYVERFSKNRKRSDGKIQN